MKRTSKRKTRAATPRTPARRNALYQAWRKDVLRQHRRRLVEKAVQEFFCGASAPSNPIAGLLWFDTASGNLKQRNTTNSAWIPALPQQDRSRELAEMQKTVEQLRTELAAAKSELGLQRNLAEHRGHRNAELLRQVADTEKQLREGVKGAQAELREVLARHWNAEMVEKHGHIDVAHFPALVAGALDVLRRGAPNVELDQFELIRREIRDTINTAMACDSNPPDCATAVARICSLFREHVQKYRDLKDKAAELSRVLAVWSKDLAP